MDVGQDIANTYPVAFLVVGLAVLFLRLEDPNAWLLALMFAGFIAIPDSGNSFAGLIHPCGRSRWPTGQSSTTWLRRCFISFSRSSPRGRRSIAVFPG